MATPPPPPPATGRLSRIAAARSGLVAAVALVLGLFAGALLVGLLAEPAPSAAANGGAGQGRAGVPGGDLPEGGGSASFLVNGSCLGAVNAAQDAYLVMDDLGAAAAALDAAQLDEIVRRLQPLQGRLQDDLDACRVSTQVQGGPEPTGTFPSGTIPTGAPPSGTAPSEATATTTGSTQESAAG